MRYIPLTQGKFTLIDDSDLEKVLRYKWYYCLVGQNRDQECVAWRGKNKKTNRQQTIIMSRYIMDAPKGMVVDHKSGDQLDNRRGNLRICTSRQNAFNQRLHRTKIRTSKYKGVSLYSRTGKWTAQLTLNYKVIYLGCFDDEKKAALAYDNAALKYFGEFARLNNV